MLLTSLLFCANAVIISVCPTSFGSTFPKPHLHLMEDKSSVEHNLGNTDLEKDLQWYATGLHLQAHLHQHFSSVTEKKTPVSANQMTSCSDPDGMEEMP